MLKRLQLLLNPFLIILIPILFVAGNNISEISGKNVLIAIVAGFAISLVFLIVNKIFIKQLENASFVASLAIFSLYIFGPVYDFLPANRNNEIVLGIMLLIALFLLCIVLSYWIIKRTKFTPAANTFISIFAISMLMMIITPVIQEDVFILKIKKIPQLIFNSGQIQNPTGSQYISNADPVLNDKVSIRGKQPDIYYIILDAYTRSDIFKEVFNFNNDEFENKLKSHGFFIADKSNSNYPVTHLSLASSLSMEHINELAEVNGAKNQEYFIERMRKPKIAEILKNAGYEYYTISSGWSATGDPSPLSNFHYGTNLSRIGNYYSTLVSMTPFRIWIGSAYAHLRLFGFKKVKEISAIKTDKPKFVFLHMTIPHLPASFESNGKIINRLIPNKDFYNKNDYIGQVQFINTKMLDIVETVLNNSEVTPIIIIQGDHGSGITFGDYTAGEPSLINIKERFAILNAYYGPHAFKEKLYPTITPVNTFRVVLNYLEIGNWELLPEKSYFQWYYVNSGIKDVTPLVTTSS